MSSSAALRVQTDDTFPLYLCSTVLQQEEDSNGKRELRERETETEEIV